VPVVQVTGESFISAALPNVAANVRASAGARRSSAWVGAMCTDGDRAGARGDRRSSAAGLVRGTAWRRSQDRISRSPAASRSPRSRAARALAAAAKLVVPASRPALADVDGVVVSDYNKGVVTRELLERLAEAADARPLLFIDPKQANFRHYANATLVKRTSRRRG